MKRTLTFEGKTADFACNALMPRLYRYHFGKDVMVELQRFSEAYKKDPGSVNYEVLENLAWLMLKIGSGDEVAKETPEDWLAELESPSTVYELAPELMEIWASSQKTTATPKKK